MTGQMTIPILWRLRLMNIGIALYLLGMTLFNLAFTLELQPNVRNSRRGIKSAICC